jgi:hypothetical protein
MMYLKIANPGAAPVESFSLLGASTTRFAGVEGTIGNFGSGAKHSINLCLRNNINPVIFCGLQRLEFYVEPTEVNDGLYSRNFGVVCFRLTGKDDSGKVYNRTEKTSVTTDYGVSDWNDLSMALREFVSNALDRSKRETGSFNYAAVEVVAENQVRAKAGETRVFVPLTPEVSKFYNELGKRFLHFSEPESLSKHILPKNRTRGIDSPKNCVIYKHGVKVAELECNDPSFYDYNFGDELRLDECRNVDQWRVRAMIALVLSRADSKTLAPLIYGGLNDKKVYEHSLDSYYLKPTSVDNEDVIEKKKKVWQEVFVSIAGADAVLSSDTGAEFVRRKGYKPVKLPDSWGEAARAYGIRCEATVLSEDDRLGREILPATIQVEKTFADVWDTLCLVEMTFNKEAPRLACYREISSKAEATVMGFYRDGTCYINLY